MDKGITETIERLRHWRTDSGRKYAEYRKLARLAEDTAVKNGRWAKVKSVKLKQGNTYYIRRSWGEKNEHKGSPRLASWDAHGHRGWRVLCGGIVERGGANATIEVWVPRKRPCLKRPPS